MATERPIGLPKAEVINHYAHRAFAFEELAKSTNNAPIGMILEGRYLVELSPIALLDAAASAEMRDPIPQCAAPIGDTHCVLQWRHPGDHAIPEV